MRTARCRRAALPSQLIATALVALGLPLAAWGQVATSDPPSQRQQAKLLKKLVSCVEDNAFVYGEDFGDLDERLRNSREALSQVASAGEFSRALNRVLASYQISHFMVMDPTLSRLDAAGTEVGAGLKSVRLADGGRIVSVLLPGGPAEKLGLVKGDVIVEVDGWTVAEDGREDQFFTPGGRLLPDASGARSLKWTRDGVAMDGVVGFAEHGSALPLELTWKAGEVGWLTLNTFSHSYDRAAIESIFDEIRQHGASGLVIDLRANGGGFSRNNFHLTSMVLPAGTALGRMIHKGTVSATSPATAGEEILVPEGNEARRYSGPLAILIDSGSGSAGELFPAYVRQNREVTLVGRTTSGSVIGAMWCKLKKGYRLLYPMEELLLPDGSRIEGVGVAPDVELTIEETVDDAFIERVALTAMAGG